MTLALILVDQGLNYLSAKYTKSVIMLARTLRELTISPFKKAIKIHTSDEFDSRKTIGKLRKFVLFDLK